MRIAPSGPRPVGTMNNDNLLAQYDFTIDTGEGSIDPVTFLSRSHHRWGQ